MAMAEYLHIMRDNDGSLYQNLSEIGNAFAPYFSSVYIVSDKRLAISFYIKFSNA